MNIVYEYGSADITVPATESICVWTEGASDSKVYRKLGYPNHPEIWSLLGTVDTARTTYGAYAGGATIRIEAGGDPVMYEVGFAPTIASTINRRVQATPIAKTTAVTLLAADILNGIVTATHTAGATAAYTLPTGTLMDAASEFVADDSFDWHIINLSAAAVDTVTLTAGTAHTIVGNPIVQSAHVTTGGITGSAARFRTRKTAANTFVTYRIC